MKSLIAVTVLFIILLTAIVLNSFYIISASDELTSAAESIPPIQSPACEKKLGELEGMWNKFKKAASFSMSYSELNKISCLIEELHVHLANGNHVDFDHGVAVLKNCLREIPRLERLSVEGLF